MTETILPARTQQVMPAASVPGMRTSIASTGTRRLVGLLLALVLLTAVCAASIAIGSRYIPLTVVLDTLRGRGDEGAGYIVRELRVPRTVVGLAVGAALGLAGALIQALTRNPLADPGILGVNAGAACAIATAIVIFGVDSISGYVWFGLIGALLVTVAVYLIGSAGRGGVDPIRLTLAGVALGAVLMGITTALMLSDAEVLDHMRVWNAGTLVNRDLGTVATIAPFLVIGLLIAAWVSGPLNAIALGDDLAQSLGVSVVRTRVLVVLAVALLSGAATAVAGPIGFIGLMMPHVARWIVGPNQRWILAYTIVLTPALLLTADVLGRIVMRPGEVPIGIISALVGAPVLIALIRRRRASGL